MAKRLQEAVEEREVHLEKQREQAKAKRMQETVEEREVHLEKAKEKAKPKECKNSSRKGGMS